MGQKTHPNGFRLATTQNHLSSWYTEKKDFCLRKYVLKNFEPFLTVAKTEISRIEKIAPEGKEKEFVHLRLHVLHPRERDMFKKIPLKLPSAESFIQNYSKIRKQNIVKARKKLNKIFIHILKNITRNLFKTFHQKTGKFYCMNFKFIKSQFHDPTLIAKYIAKQLEKRIPFRRVMKQVIAKAQASRIKGIKLELSGRLNGIEIARSEWKRNGKIPLHTLRASIKYTHEEAQTIYGIIGIKVWLLKQ